MISHPLLPSEVDQHENGDNDHHSPKGEVSPRPFQFRHVFEIHPINPGEEGQRHKDGGDDGEHLHDLVHPVADGGEVDVQHSGKHVPVGLDRVDHLDGMVVDVAEVDGRRLAHERRVGPAEGADHLSEGPDRFTKEDDLPFEGLNGSEGLGRRAADQSLFHIFDLLSEFVQDDEVAVDDRVEERMGEVVDPGLPQAALFVADPLPDGIEEVSLLLLKGDQPVGAEDDADLFGNKAAIFRLMKEFEYDVENRRGPRSSAVDPRSKYLRE
jgi:hypothetical protein